MSYFEKSPHVTELSPSDFSETVVWKLKKHNCCAILFYKPSCPFCQQVKKDWEKLGEVAKFFDVFAFNAEKYQDFILIVREEMPELIMGYPTMLIYKKGEPVESIGEDEKERKWTELLKICMRVCNNG